MKRRLGFCLLALVFCAPVAVASGDAELSRQTDVAGAARAERARVRGGYLGISLAEVTQEAVRRLNLKQERGALVTYVEADSPAAKADLRVNDVIVRWEGEPVESAIQLWRLKRETPAGRTVRLGVARGGSESEISLTIGEPVDRPGRLKAPRAPRIPRAPRPARVAFRDRGRLGVELHSMTPQLAEYFGLGGRSGALIAWVRADSPAAKAGLKAGDVILSIAGDAIDDPRDVRQKLGNRDEGPIEVKVLRDRREQTFTVQLEKGRTWSRSDHGDWFDELVIVIPKIVVRPPEVRIRNVVPVIITRPVIKLTRLQVST
jgi:membrane-associated protease RseP (regulator of RpoE activity)